MIRTGSEGVGRRVSGVVNTFRGLWAASTGRRPTPDTRRPCVLVALGLLLGSPLAAQPRVRLELRPQPGDTIRMRVEQETRVAGWKGARDAGAGARATSMSLRLWSRAVVLERVAGATHVLTITDSARIVTTDPHAGDAAARAERAMAGRTMRLRVASDGTARLLGQGGDRDLSTVVSAMPAALPHQPVAVGEKWRREMPLPSADGVGPAEGVIRAVFRLDSLTERGAVAWISVKGELSREPAPAFGGRVAAADLTGTLAGTLVLDRKRGWLDESSFALDVHTVVAPPAGDGTPPLRVHTRVRQQMKAVGGRGAVRGARP